MTNPTQSLLSRYAACADKLRGTGAPEVYPWIKQRPSRRWVIKGSIRLSGRPGSFENNEANLCGFVCWAMEVMKWAKDETDVPMAFVIGASYENIAATLEAICEGVGK